jgi:hypothetical protein
VEGGGMPRKPPARIHPSAVVDPAPASVGAFAASARCACASIARRMRIGPAPPEGARHVAEAAHRRALHRCIRAR